MSKESYEVWLTQLFGHDESKGDWRWDDEVDDFTWNEEQIVNLVTKTLKNYREDVAHYSDWQIAMGVDFIFNSGQEYAYALRDGSVPIENRIEAIRSIKYIYKYCFDRRCDQVLGHLSEPENPLNDICYMLWDVTPLIYCEDNPRKQALYEAVADVMEYSLSCRNVACIESGLHGPEYLTPYFPTAKDIIQSFIESGIKLDPRLLKYAEAAKSDCIN